MDENSFKTRFCINPPISDNYEIFEALYNRWGEEYFFVDWDKIIKILGDSNIYTQKNSANLGFTHTGKNYSRNYASLKDSQTYINIYTSKANNTNQNQTA